MALRGEGSTTGLFEADALGSPSESDRLDAITIGETMVLLTAEHPGRLRYADRFVRTAGGAESNFAIGLSRLGLRAGWISKVGDDEFGAYVVSQIRSEGIDVARVAIDPSRPTGVFFKERAREGEARVFYYRREDAAAALAVDDIDWDFVLSARHFHTSGITLALSDSCREVGTNAIRRAFDSGRSVSLDANLRLRMMDEAGWRALITPILASVTFFLLTRDEAALLFGIDDPMAAARHIRTIGPTVVGVKDGPRGVWLATDEGLFHQPAELVDAVQNTHGAGDAFAAGLVGGHLLGWPWRKAARAGAILGAAATTVAGNIEGLPTLSEILRRLEGAEPPPSR